MDFKRGEKRVNLLLPPRSLLIMSGESRYAWSHGICPRHSDIVHTSNGLSTRERSTRTSFTFRKVRTGDCPCHYDEYCDTKKNPADSNIGNSVAPALESSYVHEVLFLKLNKNVQKMSADRMVLSLYLKIISGKLQLHRK